MTDSPLEKSPPPYGLEKQQPARPAGGPVDVPADAPPDRAAGPAGDGGGGAAVRASDADRDRVADVLREALAEGRLDAAEHAERIDAVYRAKTLGELRPLVGDLPAAGGATQGGHLRHERDGRGGAVAAPIPYPAGTRDKDNVVAVFSGAVRKGRFRVPRKINTFACFGGIEIDLTDAVFAHPFVQINATAVFGGIEIRVPENVTLQQKGAGIFGGFDVHATHDPDPDAPVVLVEGAAIFGGVEAKPRRGKRIRDLRDRLRKQL